MATSFFLINVKCERDINMTLLNIGSKIINVGTTILMPGDKMEISEEISKLPAIQAFVELGFISIVGEAKAPAAVESVPAAEETAAKRGRRAKADEAAAE